MKTLGDLRKRLKDLPDNTLLLSSVIGQPIVAGVSFAISSVVVGTLQKENDRKVAILCITKEQE